MNNVNSAKLKDTELPVSVKDSLNSSTPVQYSLFSKFSDELVNNEKVASEIASGKRFGFYRFIKDIGAGNFSKVKLAVHAITREYVAVKILDKMKLSSKTQHLLSREITSMEHLQHPHIIRLYEVMESMTKLYMVMEYAAGGELHTHVTTKGKMKESDAKEVFSQIVSAIEYMHDRHVIHRDIKAENIFIVRRKFVKIGDFGFSALVSPHQCMNTFCGSPSYAAPELFKDDYYLGGYVDIWATGVLLFFLVTGEMPFRAQSVGLLKTIIVAGRYNIPTSVSPQCSNLITNILRQSPSERFTWQQIKDCEWFEGSIFPSPNDHFEINPRVPSRTQFSDSDLEASSSSTVNNSSERQSGSYSSEEVEVYRQLRNLGITNEDVRRSQARASRSSVTGVYRIILHQLHKKKSSGLMHIPLPEDETPSKRTSTSSKTCAIL